MKITINKKVLSIAILLLGLGIIILTMGLFNTNTNSNNNPLTPSSSKFPLNLSNFTIDKSIDDEVTLTLKIKNTTLKDINNQILKLNFYNKDNYLLHTYQYDIISLKVENEILVKANIGFVYEEISKYEFLYNGKTLQLEPKIM